MKSQLDIVSVSGTAHAAGRIYGEQFAQNIRGFCSQELPSNRRAKAYALKCWEETRKFAPTSSSFVKGMAKGCQVSIELLARLLLHEEFYHLEVEKRKGGGHCTGYVASNSATVGGRTLIAQSWDWQSKLFPWPGLLKLKVKNRPKTLTYHYPGLWACCGLNSKGFGLMWTGGGYYPPLKPKVGVPTYALVSELLWKNSVEEAIDYLQGVKNAGAFMFLLGDHNGNTAVIESVPGEIFVQRDSDIYYRANLYENPKCIKAGKQKIPTASKCHSVKRLKKLKQLGFGERGKLSVSQFKDVMSTSPILVELDINHLTIDRLIADLDNKVLWTRRGGSVANSFWKKVTL